MQVSRIPVAQEGLPFILFAALCALVFALLGLPYPALLALALSAFVLFFFRDPVRVTPNAAGAVISPADGKVIMVREIEDTRFLDQRVQKISIFMNVFNVHVNRMPLSGTVEQVRLRPGRFYAADHHKAELHNEYCALTIATATGQRYALVQVAGLIARRIVCRAEVGDRLETGERYGLIRFGSRVDLYLPLQAEIRVQVGDRVRAGESLLATLHAPGQ